MTEFKCKIQDLSRDYRTGESKVTLSTEDKGILRHIEKLNGKDLTCKISLFRKKRSLDANAYCWVLLDKLSEKINLPKEELYKGYIRNLGGNCECVCMITEAVKGIAAGWKHNGLGWIVDTAPSEKQGHTNVFFYCGSSTYDTKQMSRLLDLIIQDCNALGIETMTPEQISHLKESWK